MDHLVIASQRPDLDLHLVPLSAPLTLALKLDLMLWVSERQLTSDQAAVPARQLASVQHRRCHVLLSDAYLDPTTKEARVDRVVVAIDP